jgi:hypothetical protein
MWVLFANKSNGWALHATFGLAGFCLFWACFLAWRDEETKVKELKDELRTLKASANTVPVQNLYFPAPPIPVRPEPLKHNIQCLGVTIEDFMVLICFQNVPKPGEPIGDFREARLSVEYRVEATGEVWDTIFPARWASESPQNVSIGVVPICAFLAAYYPLEDRKWKALRNDKIEGITLPPDRFRIKATLIGENNLSIKPIKGILTLEEDGRASWVPTE